MRAKRDDYPVLVIGGGIVGAWVLYVLARRGRAAILLEAGQFSSGATGASAAIIRNYHHDDNLTEISALSWPYFEDLGGDWGFQKTGSLYFEPREYKDSISKKITGLQERGLSCRIIEGNEGKELFPAFLWDDGTLAIYEPNAGVADPKKTTELLIQKARNLGCTALSYTPARELLSEGSEIVAVATEKAQIDVHSVVLCAGVWTQDWVTDLPVSARPIQVSVVRKTHAAFHPCFFDFSLKCFGRSLDSVTSAVGSSLDEASRRMPELEKSTPVWSYRASDLYTEDRRALIQKEARFRNLFIATGFSGSGFKTAPIAALRIVDLAVGA